MIRSTRQAICDALAHAYLGSTQTANLMDYGCQIDRSSGNQAYLMAIAVQYAKIRAAISAQKPHISDWLYYSYGPDLAALNKDDRIANIAAQVARDAFHWQISHKKKARLLKIAHIAVVDYRVGQTMGRRMPIETYTKESGIDGHNWARDWDKYRVDALNAIQSYDLEGVGNVSITVREIRNSESE